MQSLPTQIDSVAYNATTQAFEAIVIIHDTDLTRKYPCSISAPITMSFEDAAAGLARQATRRHGDATQQSSYVVPHQSAPRAGRMNEKSLHWLSPIKSFLGKRAA